MSSEPTTSQPPAGNRDPVPVGEHDDLRGDLTQARTAIGNRTVERDEAAEAALEEARRARADRDAARGEVERLQVELNGLREQMAHYACSARTPVYDSACRWVLGHTGRHQTVGGWTWSQ